MINKLIEQIGGRERLEFIAENAISRDRSMMARALLAVLDAQSKPALVLRPFGYDGETFRKSDIDHHSAVVYYTVPPATSVLDVNFDLSKPGTEATVITHYQVPDGWKLVPVEPTAKMMVAGTLVSEFQEDPAGMYQAMIAAAPAPDGTI